MSSIIKRKAKVLPAAYIQININELTIMIGPKDSIVKIYNEKSNDYDIREVITNKDISVLKQFFLVADGEKQELETEINKMIDKANEINFELLKEKKRIFSKKQIVENLQKDLDETSKYMDELNKQLEESKANIFIKIDPDIKEQYQKLSVSFEKLLSCMKIWNALTDKNVAYVENLVSRKLEAFNKRQQEHHEYYIKNFMKSTFQLSEHQSKEPNRKEIIEVETLIEYIEHKQFSIKVYPVTFKLNNNDFIKSKYHVFNLQNANNSQLFIYPAFMILIEESKKITVIDLKELNVNSSFQNFIYPYPEDTEVIGMTWNNVNSDGSPDLRVRDNKKLPIMRFGVLSFSTNHGWSEKYFLSNGILAQIFAKEFNKYISLLKNDYSGTDTSISIDITKEYFNLLKEFADKFDSFLTKVKKDEDFINFIKNSHLFSEQSSDKYENIINYVACKDLVVCFEKTADISNLKSKESFALMYLILKKFIDNNIDYANISQLYEEILLSRYQKFIKEMYKLDESNDDNLVFDLSLILGTYNKELLQEYLTILYRFASIVVKADGTVTKEEEAVLKKILSLSENKMLNLSQTDGKKDEKTKVIFQSKEQTLEQTLEELNSLIGLGLVKQEINSLINFIKIQKARESEGLKSSSLSYHIVFTGNPGTGKTTVARVISDIYKNLGVLKQGHLVETDRSGLIAEYVGQTAVKVNKIVDSALDGILFIDEAYSLVGDNQDNFGKEAVATLIKRMEDNRDKLVVILAGYTNEMKDFIDTNPGLKSRFNRYIEFVDYTPEDLLAIYKLQCSKLDYNLTEDASKKISKIFSLAFASRDKSFGNGRFARNIFEKTLEKQANRIASIPSLTKEILTTITIEDIPDELVDWAKEDTSDEKQIKKDEIVSPDEIIAEVYKDGINYKAKIKDTENDITDLINNPAKLKYAYERSGSIRGKKNNAGIYDWRVIASPKTDAK